MFMKRMLACDTSKEKGSQSFSELGRTLFRCSYRMQVGTFFDFYKVLKKELIRVCGYDMNRVYSPNGRIHPSVRLACAIRLFAGGDPIDMCIYCISKTEVHVSFEYVIDAVNNCSDLKLQFPSSHTYQCAIVDSFN